MSDLLSQSAVKREYKLTTEQVRLLGSPDQIIPNPLCESRPIKLFERSRVEAWLQQQRPRYRKVRRH